LEIGVTGSALEEPVFPVLNHAEKISLRDVNVALSKLMCWC
jgi:hypothetical protein